MVVVVEIEVTMVRVVVEMMVRVVVEMEMIWVVRTATPTAIRRRGIGTPRRTMARPRLGARIPRTSEGRALITAFNAPKTPTRLRICRKLLLPLTTKDPAVESRR